MLLDPVYTAELAASMADKVVRVLQQPFRVGDDRIQLSATVGIALCPRDGICHDELVSCADSALERGRHLGETCRFHDAAAAVAIGHTVELEDDPRAALDNGEFELHFQPRMDLASGAIIGAEALLRWPHPVRGPISPATFIPIAERTDLIHDIGTWVLERACAQAACWSGDGHSGPRVSVNVSGRQLDHPLFPRMVERVLADYGLPADRLELEITESAMINRPEDAAIALSRPRSIGVRIALDDFGTGYSSLACLRRLPLDVLKLDRGFIGDLAAAESTHVVLRTVVDLAHALGLRVVAEGGETAAQYAAVAAQQCDELQGFWLAPPMPAAEFDRKFLGRSPACASPGTS